MLPIYRTTIRRVRGILMQTERASYMRNEYRPSVKHINCVLPKDDFERVEKVAQTHRKKTTSFFREAALAYLDQEYLVPEDLNQRLHELSVQIRWIGDHLNQIARYTNMFKKVTYLNLTKSGMLLARLERLIGNFVRCPAKK